MKKDYKEKIKKLLALAESPNENEAKSALLKARELMAEHKLTEADCKEAGKRKAKEIITEWTSSKRRDPWITLLAEVIAQNHSCIAFFQRLPGKQTAYTGFIGIEDDVELCAQIFDYAAKCVQARINEFKKDYKNIEKKHPIPSVEFRTAKYNSYGYGFVKGLYWLYMKQNEEVSGDKRYELMTMVPKEVQEATQGFKQVNEFNQKAINNINASSYLEGVQDGQNFNPAERINQEKEDNHEKRGSAKSSKADII